MTNKPMLSVELRALLNNCADYMEGSASGKVKLWHKELRAFLDKEVDGDSRVPERQSDPVAICRLWNEGGSGERTSVEFIGEPCADGTLLYAEQPAPVAKPITDEQILEAMRPAIYAADGGYVFDTAKADVVSAGRALLDAAAVPVAVMMSEHESANPYWPCDSAEEKEEFEKWRSDKRARLNGVKP